MIFDHECKEYRRKWHLAGNGRFNGAYFYSKEIVENIIPNIKTDRNWVTVNALGACADHSIVFIHNNMNADAYNWLLDYKDLVLVCGIKETCEKVAHLGKTIYLPLSIDVKEVKAHKAKKKTKEVAYVGRLDKKTYKVPRNTPVITDMPRTMLLDEVAKCKKVYAVGRCALEAKVLGCEILPYDDRYPDVELWQVLDNSEVVPMLQSMLDEIDKEVAADD